VKRMDKIDWIVCLVNAGMGTLLTTAGALAFVLMGVDTISKTPSSLAAAGVSMTLGLILIGFEQILRVSTLISKNTAIRTRIVLLTLMASVSAVVLPAVGILICLLCVVALFTNVFLSRTSQTQAESISSTPPSVMSASIDIAKELEVESRVAAEVLNRENQIKNVAVNQKKEIDGNNGNSISCARLSRPLSPALTIEPQQEQSNEIKALKKNWSEVTESETGNKYYVHEKTGAVSWNYPEELDKQSFPADR